MPVAGYVISLRVTSSINSVMADIKGEVDKLNMRISEVERGLIDRFAMGQRFTGVMEQEMRNVDRRIERLEEDVQGLEHRIETMAEQIGGLVGLVGGRRKSDPPFGPGSDSGL